MSWECKNCNEHIEDNFDSCWSCGFDKKGKAGNIEDSFELKEMEGANVKLTTPVLLLPKATKSMYFLPKATKSKEFLQKATKQHTFPIKNIDLLSKARIPLSKICICYQKTWISYQKAGISYRKYAFPTKHGFAIKSK